MASGVKRKIIKNYKRYIECDDKTNNKIRNRLHKLINFILT